MYIPARRKRRPAGIFELARPLALLICALFAIRAAFGYGIISFKLPVLNALDMETVINLETGRWTMQGLSGTSLLTLSSPLLVSKAQPAEEAQPVFAPQPSVPVSSPAAAVPSEVPALVPRLTMPPSEPSALAVTGEPLDDRVWPQPSAGDPGAKPLREVTLLPGGGEEYSSSGGVFINNDTGYTVDIPALLKMSPVLKTSDSSKPQILIIHTHGSESYVPDERNYYVPTDIERTEDTRYNVVRLGDIITERFTDMGLNVIHDRDIHDFPSYNGSYSSTLKCIEQYIKEYPSIQMVLDIHRDSISSNDGTMYKTICETDEGKAAQMMFVAASDARGLHHPNWRKNLSFAAQLQSKLLGYNPTLMRPIHLRKERFNQHATTGSLILEVGTAGNTLTEAIRSVEIFCEVTGPWLCELLSGT